MNAHLATSRAYLAYQYSDAEKLRARIATHQDFSERRDSFADWLAPRLDPRPGLALDVGAGPGAYHRALAASGMAIVSVDFSLGMARAAREQAQRATLPVFSVQGDIARLPLAGAAFDRIMANHMLYHVPDIATALRELRRVSAPRARVVLATNAADSMERLLAIHRESARALGFTPTPPVHARFNLDHLPLVRGAFPRATVERYDDAFLFTSSAPALAYYASGFVDGIEAPPADGSHREPLLRLFAERIDGIIAREGVFRVPKASGAFVAVVD